MTQAARMRALGQYRFGGVEALEEIELPVPQPSGADLLVRMEAVAINPVDTKVRSNWNGFGQLQGGGVLAVGGVDRVAHFQVELGSVSAGADGGHEAGEKDAGNFHGVVSWLKNRC